MKDNIEKEKTERIKNINKIYWKFIAKQRSIRHETFNQFNQKATATTKTLVVQHGSLLLIAGIYTS